MAEDLINRIESRRLRCGGHFLSLQPIIELLRLLVLTLLVTIGGNKARVLAFQSIRVYLEIWNAR